jgi:IS30 family transposase
MKDTANKKRPYRVLSPAEREEIMVGLRTDRSLRSIARSLKRNPSVIARELQNNRTEDGRYQAYWAEQRSQRRRRDSRKRPRIGDPLTREYPRAKLKLGWSPEQIAGWIALELPGTTLSHETIYLYIFNQKPSLTQYLACGRKRRRKRAKKHAKRVLIAQRGASKSVRKPPISAVSAATGKPTPPSAARVPPRSWCSRSANWG